MSDCLRDACTLIRTDVNMANSVMAKTLKAKAETNIT